MKNKGRAKDNALLRTLANKQAQNFATRRLLHDLKEIDNERLPTVGVSARPLSSNLFEWHANIKGPAGTLYEGGVFHFALQIPESYPHQPPTVTVFNELPHPNVFGQNICLDILNAQKVAPSSASNELGSFTNGWSSGYTIQSILIQLQSFLFEKKFEEDEKTWERKVRKAVESANQFKCSNRDCKHGGKLSAWPEFNRDETKNELFILLDYEEREFFRQELVCYHTKLPYTTSQLGVGLSVTKVPRTGLIQNASISLDYLSIKAFIKEGIRWGVDGGRFTHWLPLYFGRDDVRERALHLGRKAIAMIMANSTRRFREEYVLELFPKIITTTVFLIMERKSHPSVRLLRFLAHIHANFLLYLEQYPALQAEIEKRIETFIKDESKRSKDHTPNLGALIAYLFAAPKSRFADIVEAYCSEQLDRQVLWILKSVPELEDDRSLQTLDEQRAMITFKAQETSFHMLCFYRLYLRIVRDQFATARDLFTHFEENYCRLANSVENELQSGIFAIFAQIDSFDKYYQYVGLRAKSPEELTAQLKQAVKNSKAKGYHGTFDEIFTLPTSQVQVKALLEKLPQITDFYEVKTQITVDEKTHKKTHKIEVHQRAQISEQQWRDACIKRWSWVREATELKQEVSAQELSEKSIQIFVRGETQQQTNNRVYDNVQKIWLNSQQTLQAPKLDALIPSPFTWEQLFIKLDLENALIYIDENPDFQQLYEKLEIAAPKLHALSIPVLSVKSLKSGYHFYTQTLSKLTRLTHLTISGLPETPSSLPFKAIKALNKGFNNFRQGEGSLRALHVYNVQWVGNPQEVVDKVFSPLVQMEAFESLIFEGTNLLHYQNAAKSLSAIITNLKHLSELRLTKQVFQSPQHAKEIADGLMRAKQLRVIDVSQNTLIGTGGLAAIIYNLAFSPRLQYLNIAYNQVSGNFGEVIESLYKLLRISASLETLDARGITSLNSSLTRDFYQSLGEIKTLRELDISNSGIIANAADFGKAIAFNAKKRGSLDFVNLRSCFNSHSQLNTFYENMRVSEHDHETWYGDPTKASKMQGKDFDKVYHNALRALILSQCGNLASNFNIANFKKYNQVDPPFLQLLARSTNVTAVTLAQNSLNRNDADLLALALDPTRENFSAHVQILTLQKNNLGKEGAKILAKVFLTNHFLTAVDLSKNQIGVSGAQELALCLRENKGVRFLNLFNNKIGFDGALAFKETLKQNSVLEFIEFGHNRIRNSGLLSIAEGIVSNATSALKTLGLRFNFLTEDGVIEFFKRLTAFPGGAKALPLQDIFVKNNSISEFGLHQLKRAYDNTQFRVSIDIFDKLRYLSQDLLDRTVFVHPLVATRSELKIFFEQTQKCGIVCDIRIRSGPKWPNRSKEPNK